MKKLPIGQSDFRRVRTDDDYYVDKSLFIKEILDDSALVLLLPRPRRFGKTLNLSMLRYFFEKNDREEETKRLFHGLAIEREEVFQTHCARYPVIFLTFKDIKFLQFDDAFEAIKLLIASEFKRHAYLLAQPLLTEKEQEQFQQIIALNAHNSFYYSALQQLSEYLCRYHQQETIVLIDEYDTPIHTAYFNGYYEEMVSFFRSFFGAGLKDNQYLFKAVLTGILRVAKESIFSDLKNLGVYPLLREEYSQSFGFTEEEVKALLHFYRREQVFDEIQDWYNGYIFGNTTIYNPWSILNFVVSKDQTFRSYWANTSSNSLLKGLIASAPAHVKTDLQDLLQGKSIQKELDENIVFPELQRNENAVFSFLVFTGYLKASDLETIGIRRYYTLAIPNLEVLQIFEDVIIKWLNEPYESHKLQLLLQALVANDIPQFEEILNDFVLSTLSYFDTQKQDVERVYQAFLLGLLVNLSPTHEINSNKESGFGRYDISIIPKDRKKTAIIMELKRIGLNEDKDSALKNALKQIEEKRYEVEILKRGITTITKLAVTFDGKRVWVKSGG